MTQQEGERPVWEPVADVTDWRLIVESRVRRAKAELAALTGRVEADGRYRAAAESLAVAEGILRGPQRRWWAVSEWWSGWRIERSWRALHDAEVYLVTVDPELAARLPGTRERVAVSLPPSDQRRQALDALDPDEPPSAADRAVVGDAVRAAFDASDEAHAAARAFRNKLVVAALVLVALNTLLGVLGFVRPNFLPMCAPNTETAGRLVCASGGAASAAGEVWLVQVMGAAGAVVATVVLLVRRRPSLAPYVMVGYQALIKVLLGALFAVVGMLALGAGLGEGILYLHTQAALLLWAVLLGYSQQFGTRLLDNYADRLLDRVRPLPV